DPDLRPAVVTVGVEGFRRHGVHRHRRDQRLDIVGVRIARVLGAGRGPERPLGPGPFVARAFHAGVSSERSNTSYATPAFAIAIVPRSPFGSPAWSSSGSTRPSTRLTKKEATEAIRSIGCPFSTRRASPSRKAAMTSR